MGNTCEFQQFNEANFQQNDRNLKKISNAPNKKYALRMKNTFPPLPSHVQDLRKKLKLPQIEEIIKDCPIYFVHEKSALYQGHWKQGQPHGYGRILYKDFSYYEGLIVQGQPNTFINPNHHQESFYIFSDGSYYRGEFKSAKFQGRGVLITKNNSVRILGEFREGLPHGKATQTFIDYNERYQGEFCNGLKQGKGQYYIDDFLVYEGDFLNGNMHGEGRLIDYNGSEFVGRFQNGKKLEGNLRSVYGLIKNIDISGKQRQEGYYQWQDGKFYIGSFVNGKFEGKGRIYYPTGRVVEGLWQKGHSKKVQNISVLSIQEIQIMRMKYKKNSQVFQIIQEQKVNGSASTVRIDGVNSHQSYELQQGLETTRNVQDIN